MSSPPLAARSKMMVLLFLSQPSGQLFSFCRAGACSKGGRSRGIRKMGSALSFLPCFKVLFLSAARPTDQGEESVLLLLLVIVVGGGAFFKFPCAVFLGCK